MTKAVKHAEAKGVQGPRRLRGVKQMIQEAHAASERRQGCDHCLQKLLEALEQARTVYEQLERQVNKEQASLRLSRAVAADSIIDIESSISEAIECEVDS